MASDYYKRRRFSFTPILECDSGVAAGIERFKWVYSKHLDRYSISSRRYSIFGLIKKHIDEPFRIFVRTNSLEEKYPFLRKFNPSDLRKSPHRINSVGSNSSTVLYHKRVRTHLEEWRILFKQIARIESQGICFGTIESLIFLIDGLILLRPSKARFPSRSNRVDTRKTIKTSDNPDDFCELCWRHTMRYKNTISGNFVEEKWHSSKFCSTHNPVSGSSRSNYIRDRRYKNLMHAELDNINVPKASIFAFPLVWFKERSRGLDFQETRKLAYDLAHSKLDSPNRVTIVKLVRRKRSVADIAKTLGLSRQAIYKNIKYIEKTINEILVHAYLDPITGEESSSKFYRGTEFKLI